MAKPPHGSPAAARLPVRPDLRAPRRVEGHGPVTTIAQTLTCTSGFALWLSERVPKLVFTSWNLIYTEGNPLAAPFLDAVAALQDRAPRRQILDTDEPTKRLCTGGVQRGADSCAGLGDGLLDSRLVASSEVGLRP